MPILCLGLNYRTAPLALRERLSFSSAALKATLSRFGCGHESQPAGITGLAILSTCNRLELYAQVPPGTAPLADRLTPMLNLLVEARGLPAVEFESHLYHYADRETVEHLCRVASGLESMVLGEPQILGQVAEAYEAALAAGAAGPVLSALFQAAIRAGKRARTETAISRNAVSLSSVAVHLAEQVLGELPGRRALIVGAGEMGELAIDALRARGVQQIAVINRTRQRAIELAERWGGEALSFEHLTSAIHQADIVIASTGAPHTILNSAMVCDAMQARTSQPLVLMDIAVPRNVDPTAGEIPGVYLFDIDRLHYQLDGALLERQNEIPQVETIVAEEVAAFETWSRGVDVWPLIADLRIKAEAVRQRELRRTLRQLPNLDPQVQQAIEQLSTSLVNKLLHEPTLRLRAEAGNGHAAEYAEAVRQLFGLATQSTAAVALEKDSVSHSLRRLLDG